MLTDDKYALVHEMSLLGYGEDRIGLALGYGAKEFGYLISTDERLRRVLVDGAIEGGMRLRRSAHEVANGGDVSMLKFLLQSQEGMVVSTRVDHSHSHSLVGLVEGSFDRVKELSPVLEPILDADILDSTEGVDHE